MRHCRSNFDLLAQVAGKQQHVAEGLPRQQPQLMLQVRNAGHRHHGLGDLASERAEAGAQSAGQDYGLHAALDAIARRAG